MRGGRPELAVHGGREAGQGEVALQHPHVVAVHPLAQGALAEMRGAAVALHDRNGGAGLRGLPVRGAVALGRRGLRRGPADPAAATPSALLASADRDAAVARAATARWYDGSSHAAGDRG